MGLANHLKSQGLTVPGLGVARHEIAGQIFGRVWNQTGPFQLLEPRLLVGYPDPLLTLASSSSMS